MGFSHPIFQDGEEDGHSWRIDGWHRLILQFSPSWFASWRKNVRGLSHAAHLVVSFKLNPDVKSFLGADGPAGEFDQAFGDAKITKNEHLVKWS